MRTISCALLGFCAGCGGTGGTLEAAVGNDGGDGVFITDGGDDASSGCTRNVDLPTIAVGAPQPFDVVIVADNSDSLIGSRNDLAAGLPNFLQYVRGRAVRFFLLTTTQYGATSQAAVSRATGQDLVTWSNAITGAPYEHPMTSYAESCTNTDGGTTVCPTFPAGGAFSLLGTWSFSMPAPIGAITPTISDAAFAAQQQAVSNAILALGGGGANESQPLCTLSRYIRQPPAQLPSHAIFIVITDSDDTHSPSDCLAAYEHTAVPSTGPTTYETSCPSSSVCDEYEYDMTAPSNATQLTYECVPVDDEGVQHPERATPRTLWIGYGATCPGSGTTCSSDQVAQATSDCSSIIGSRNVVQSCAVTCTSGGASYCSLVRTTDTPNLCSASFSESGVTYANLADYCAKTQPGPTWSNCTVSGEDFVDGGQETTYSEEDRLVPVSTAATASDLVTQFKLVAARVFGGAGYAVETIQLDPSFSCTVGAGQSYGATLKSLASSPSNVFPLCGDYSAALKALQGFADDLVPSSYPVALGPGQTVIGVTVIDGAGNRRPLPAADYTYDAATGSLGLTAGAVQVSDASLLVTVASDCGPR